MVGLNDWKRPSYGGPCPRIGREPPLQATLGKGSESRFAVCSDLPILDEQRLRGEHFQSALAEQVCEATEQPSACS